MSKIRSIGMAGGTLACALSIGFYVQHGDDARQPTVASSAVVPVATKALPSLRSSDQSVNEPLELKDIVLTSAQPETPKPVSLHRRQVTDPSLHEAGFSRDELTLPTTPEDPSMPELGCKVSARAAPAPMASVQLSVDAPCFPNERVTVHHNGMMFTAVTDTDGTVHMTVPALSDRPIFIADFGNGKAAVATASVPDLKDYDRVVLQWSGETGFQIHAREFGASYGDRGHVWVGANASGADGSVVRLGARDTFAPKLAEVYTYPSGTSAKTGTVTLSIETEVTAANCGRDISAQTLELRSGTSLRTQDVTLSMPNCTAIGDFLVLNNLVDDLTIAAK
ncbi:hypothetical protein [Falsiphaeobacter marinintestinus]|uniref:hypothetical protein n=1 Tax=Falsiphaeobacter marinintestinus TaxID=1492905 RepID=UPI0011B6FB3F|nr:hypothetical protein [Phaeobacter marinintestinus]